ncbi:MAG: TonB-dependent receptor [Candidatus Aminicenantes bacterium]|nr:TonB-dependent receptor [Candidatus Aminicenantes bacterium]
MSKWRNGLLALLGILMVSGILSAQVQSGGTGRIYGTVADEDGNPLPGVSVEADSPKFIGKATTVTDADGIYRLFALQPGTYRIAFTLQGFKPLIREGIVVQMNMSIKLDAALQMGALEEEVTVIGQSPLIDVKSTVKGMTLTKEMFEVLPRGRNFDTLATAIPGVNAEPWLGGISVDGASGAENMFYMDGTEINNNQTGVRAQSAAFEFVEEVQIKASGYPAEYGGALGGVVSVVTRQGGNEYHGEVIGFYEGSKLNGKERDTLRLDPDIVAPTPEYVNYQDLYGKDLQHRYEGGFSLGGYILKDRLWFFGSVLPIYRKTVRTIDWLTTADVKEADNFTQNYYWYNFQAKLTAQPLSFMRVGASFVNNFSKYKGNLPSRDGSGSSTDIYDQYGFSYPNYSFSGFADLTFGNNFMINVRGGRFFYNTTDQLVNSDSPRLYLRGYGTAAFPEIPAELQRPRYWQNHGRIYETKKLIRYKNHAEADFTFYVNLAGEHAWKAGIGYVKQGEDVDNSVNMQYPDTYFYWDQDCIRIGNNYGRGTYGYVEVRGNADTGPLGEFYNAYNERWALYLQDSWTIADRLTLNLGIRAETEYLPPFTDKEHLDPAYMNWRPMDFGWGDKLSPRVGFVYDIFGDASLKVFGSFGRYYDVIKTYQAVHSYGGFKWKSAYYALNDYHWDQWGAMPPAGNTLLEVLDWRHPSYDSTDPDLKPISQDELSGGLEKMLMENVSFTGRFVYKHLRYMIEDVGVLVPGVGEVYYEANPGYGYTLHQGNGTGKFDPMYPETPKAKREYYAVNLSVDKRLSDNWLAGFSYTWSRLTGNTSGLGAADEYGRVSPYVERMFDNWAMAVTKDLDYIDGPLPTDRTHFFKFYGAYTFPFRLTIGTVINAMSGTPFTENWSLWNAYWYPFNRGYQRNGTSGDDLYQERMPFFWFANAYAEYNLRLAGKYTLQFNLNVDNLFDLKISQRYYPYRCYEQLDVSEEEVLAGNWDLEDPGRNFVPDPRYKMKDTFQGAISARIGVKFIF